MINLDFSDDSDLRDVLKRMISAVLPHENYDKRYFSDILAYITKLVKEDEMPLEFQCIVSVLSQLSKIKVVISDESYAPTLSRETLDNVLETGIVEFIKSNSFRVEKWMFENSQECNLEIPEHREKASETLYNATVELYDECFEMAQSSSEAPTIFISYDNAFLSSAINESIRTQVEIVQKGLRIGRVKYSGYQDSHRYSKMLNLEVDKRLNEGGDGVIVLDSPESLKKINDMNKAQSQRLGNWGIPCLDDVTPMLKHRLVVLVANPNVGKTLFACQVASKLIREGKRVLFYCGESPVNKIKNMVTSNYIFNGPKGYFVTTAQISGQIDCSEEVQRIINIADMEISNSGNLIFIDELHYDKCYDELESTYERHKFDAVIIDHSLALSNSSDSKLRDNKSRVDAEAEQLRNFKKKYPIMVFVTSHTSVAAQAELIKFGHVYSSPPRDSGILDKEADEEFILKANDTMDKGGFEALQIYKRRDKSAPKSDVILKLRKDVIDFEYKDEYQKDTADDLKKDQALSNIEKVMNLTDTEEEGLEIELF